MQKSLKPASVRGCPSKRWLPAAVLLILFLLVSGCAVRTVPVETEINAPDRDLFAQGVDELADTDSPAAFARLAAEFPTSPWTARSKTVGKIQAELQATKGELSQIRKSLDACRTEREKLAADTLSRDEVQKKLDTCTVEKARLGADIRSLEKHILKLKSLLSESGIAEPSLPVR